MISSVGFIGSGNVATQLSKAFKKAGISIEFIYSPSQNNCQLLANQVDCECLDSLKDLPKTNAVFLCVNDDYISELSNDLKNTEALIVHTSGSVGLDELKQNKNHGVFYPFQSISKTVEPNWKEIPLMIEGNSEKNSSSLITLANLISNQVIEADSEVRRTLHLTGVLVNNFTNHLASLSFELLQEKKLPKTLLYPLIEETARKVLLGSPDKTQTGPAIRKDQKTIQAHLNLLESKKELSAIYTLLTKSIQSSN
ncbi:MAG: Rossmann-like and DUF2520 domain-containing protein [Salibacteraceae bacterium]